MPTDKTVRFASTNILYSLFSPPRAISFKDLSTAPRPVGKRRNSTPTTMKYPAMPAPTPLPAKHHFMTLPTRSKSMPKEAVAISGSTSSRRSSSKRTPLADIYAQPGPAHEIHHVSLSLPPTNSSSVSSSAWGTPKKSMSLPLPEPRAATEMYLHQLLAFGLMSKHLKYDLSLPCSVLTELYPTNSLLEPATSPPVPSLLISSTYLQWPIIAHSNTNKSYVTVWDVVSSLFYTLTPAVSRTEYQALPEDVRRRVDAAYFARVRGKAGEEKKGVKRVDFLQGRTRFRGLSGTRGRPNVWELNVE
ncbi:hypothetical protein C8J56DRAFT_944357 [Mycena floridula]|nr:hypothetical protein C8J56DRAFT_944357 [Mycena floridula]